MFGVGTLFHRLSWTPGAALRMGRVDHVMIYALIAGTYAPIGLLVVHRAGGCRFSRRRGAGR